LIDAWMISVNPQIDSAAIVMNTKSTSEDQLQQPRSLPSAGGGRRPTRLTKTAGGGREPIAAIMMMNSAIRRLLYE